MNWEITVKRGLSKLRTFYCRWVCGEVPVRCTEIIGKRSMHREPWLASFSKDGFGPLTADWLGSGSTGTISCYCGMFLGDNAPVRYAYTNLSTMMWVAVNSRERLSNQENAIRTTKYFHINSLASALLTFGEIVQGSRGDSYQTTCADDAVLWRTSCSTSASFFYWYHHAMHQKLGCESRLRCSIYDL